MMQEYAYRMKVLETTGIIIASKGSEPLKLQDGRVVPIESGKLPASLPPSDGDAKPEAKPGSSDVVDVEESSIVEDSAAEGASRGFCGLKARKDVAHELLGLGPRNERPRGHQEAVAAKGRVAQDVLNRLVAQQAAHNFLQFVEVVCRQMIIFVEQKVGLRHLEAFLEEPPRQGTGFAFGVLPTQVADCPSIV